MLTKAYTEYLFGGFLSADVVEGSLAHQQLEGHHSDAPKIYGHVVLRTL